MRKPSPQNARPMPENELKKLKENALGVLAEVRRQLLSPTRSPFVGSIAMNMDLHATRDRRNPTASTDGLNIYFDIDFLSGLSPEDRLFVFAHEIWHNALCHFSRMDGGRNKNLSNIATDLEVNQLLKEDGFSVPKEALMPQRYNLPTGKSAEEYYELLLKQASQNQKSGGGGASGGMSGSLGGQDPNGSGGNEDGKLAGQFDKHLNQNYDPSADKTGQGQSDKYGAIGEDPDFCPEVKEGAVEKMRELVVSAAQQVERSRGSMPGHLAALVKELLEPEIPWQEVLAQFVTRAAGNRTNWSRPNRRYVSRRMYLPSKDGEKIKIVVGVDTSGSTASDMKKFLSEVNGLVKNYGNYELHLIQCDWEVQDYHLYTEDDPLDLEHNEFKVAGGGGTQMKPIFDYIEQNELDVDCIAIFTDGYVETFTEADAPAVPVLWIVTEDGNTDGLGFGDVLKFKNPKE